MEFKTKYITVDDFNNYFGEDLDAELKSGEKPHMNANVFLTIIETRMETFIDANFYRNVEKEYPVFTDYQKKHYKLALLEQAMYVFRNGDISSDSGYDSEKGVVISQSNIKNLSIAPNAKNELILCGLWCRKIKGNDAFLKWLM